MSYRLVKLAYGASLRPIDIPGAVQPLIEKSVLARACEFADHDGSKVKPSQKRIAIDLEMSERSVRAAVAQLTQRGVLQKVRPANPLANRPAEYRICIDVLTALQREGTEDNDGIPEPLAGMDGLIEEPGAGMEAVIAAPGSSHSGTGLLYIPEPPAANPSIYPLDNPSEENHPASHRAASVKLAGQPGLLMAETTFATSDTAERTDNDIGFEEFWSACPKRQGKGEARKAYGSALKRGASAGQLLMAIRRYAERVAAERTENRFIKTPGPWLNAERWADDLPPIDRSPIGAGHHMTGSGQRPGMMAAIAAAADAGGLFDE